MAPFHLWLTLLLLGSVCASAVHPRKLKRFGGVRRFTATSEPSSDLPPEYEIHYYTQTLDHFNYYPDSYATFQHRYILNYKYWGGANTSSPIFVYTGEEVDVTYDVETFIIDLAARFKGLLLYIEVIFLVLEPGLGKFFSFSTPRVVIFLMPE